MPGGMTGIEPELLRHGAMTLGRWLRKPYTALDLARTLRRALEPQASALHREGDGATAQAL